jgi:Papain family cysteine protease
VLSDCCVPVEGLPYYLVKNEWSAYWGDHGYIQISRDKDCGISTEAFAVRAAAAAR